MAVNDLPQVIDTRIIRGVLVLLGWQRY